MMTQLQMTWGWLVAFYLFLGGLGAGAFVVAAAISLAPGSGLQPSARRPVRGSRAPAGSLPRRGR